MYRRNRYYTVLLYILNNMEINQTNTIIFFKTYHSIRQIQLYFSTQRFISIPNVLINIINKYTIRQENPSGVHSILFLDHFLVSSFVWKENINSVGCLFFCFRISILFYILHDFHLGFLTNYRLQFTFLQQKKLTQKNYHKFRYTFAFFLCCCFCVNIMIDV